MNEVLWSFYLNTVVEVFLEDGRSLTIEQVPEVGGEEWPFDVDFDAAWILTACNPRSEPLSDEANAERHRQLGEQLAQMGYPYLETIGIEDSVQPQNEELWSEPGYLVLGVSADEVIELARAWEQNAVYKWAPDHWELVGVLMPGATRVGWRFRQ